MRHNTFLETLGYFLSMPYAYTVILCHMTPWHVMSYTLQQDTVKQQQETRTNAGRRRIAPVLLVSKTTARLAKVSPSRIQLCYNYCTHYRYMPIVLSFDFLFLSIDDLAFIVIYIVAINHHYIYPQLPSWWQHDDSNLRKVFITVHFAVVCVDVVTSNVPAPFGKSLAPFADAAPSAQSDAPTTPTTNSQANNKEAHSPDSGTKNTTGSAGMSSGAATSSLADGSAVKPISIQVSVVDRVTSYWGVVMAKHRYICIM